MLANAQSAPEGKRCPPVTQTLTTMSKKTIFLMLALLCIGTAQAQRDNKPPVFTFGPKAGLNFSTLVRDTRNFTSEYQLGYHAGVFLRFNAGRIYIQPEVFFATKGAKINIDQSVDPNVRSGSYRLRLNNVDVPVILGLSLLNTDKFNIRLFGGPMASFNLNGKGVSEFIKEQSSISEAYRKAVLGYQAGVGFDIGALTIDGRYEGAITETGDWDRVGLGKPKGGLYQVSVGFKIL